MTLPTWSHCIPTLNRIEVLEEAVRLSLEQTFLPVEIIIVDASENIDPHRARIEAILAMHPGQKPDLIYLQSPVKSLTQQRNIAIERARGDILFLFDDDTLMYPDCAEAVIKTFAVDSDRQIAAAMALGVPQLPGHARVDENDRKVTGTVAKRSSLHDTKAAAWIWNHIFMMSAVSHFVEYDNPRRIEPADMISVGPLWLLRVPLLSGYAMCVRAEVARQEPFDPALVSYCPAEDLDASYRFSRHGLNVLIETARVHHFESATGRIKRRQAITLGLMNLAAFVARNSRNRNRDIPAYYLRYARRLLAEFLKDALSRRFTFPQFIGVISAFAPTVAIFRRARDGFDDWYRTQQMRVLNWPATSPPAAHAPSPSTPATKG
jgi:GT2 family glycosyltransferase